MPSPGHSLPRTFRDVFADVAPLYRLGDVRFRYEPSLLMAEVMVLRTRWSSASVGGAAALAAGGLSAAVLLSSPSQIGLATVLAILAAVFAAWVLRAESKTQGRNGFVLNFATETLRLDLPGRGKHGPGTVLVSFDQVRDLLVEPSASGTQALVVYFKEPAQEMVRGEVLVDRIAPREEEPLRRTFRKLRAALGLPEEELD